MPSPGPRDVETAKYSFTGIFSSQNNRQHENEKSPKTPSPKELRNQQSNTEEDGSTGVTVEFSSSIYYCEEGDGHVEVEVIRRGILDVTSMVEFTTTDCSAKAGQKFKETKGTLNFSPGESSKIIHIELVEDNSFDATLEFEVDLVQSWCADIGYYLGTCRVIIADNDTFPTNRFSEQLNGQKVADIPHWPLMFEFWKMNLADRHFRWCCLKNLIGDQISNLNYAFSAYLMNYLVDNVLRPADGSAPPDNAAQLVWAIVGIAIVPRAIIWLFDRWGMSRRIKGQVVARLQANLLRKFLNYNEASRNIASTSDLTMAISRDVPELAEDGVATCFSIARHLGLLAILSVVAIQQMNSGFVFAIGIFAGAPLSMILFLILRHKGTNRRRRNAFRRQTELVGYLQQTIDCFRLITDYAQGPSVVTTFSDKIKACNDAGLDSALWENTNKHFAPLMQTIVCGAYILLTFQDVLNGSPLGEFMTGVALCHKIGQCYEGVYTDVLTIGQGMASLHNVVFYMNLPIDVPQRMRNSRFLLSEARKLRHTMSKGDVAAIGEELVKVGASKELSKCFGNEKIPEDSMPITGRRVTFTYPHFTGAGNTVLDRADFCIKQGTLVAVTGPRLGGKATLLHLLGKVVPESHPVEGEESFFFCPPFLRVLHVSFNPQLICNLNLFENLCFGPSDGTDEDPERVIRICQDLRMSESTLMLVRANCGKISREELIAHMYRPRDGETAKGKVAVNHDGVDHMGTPLSVANRHLAELSAKETLMMSHTDKCVLHLARALIMNPDVLVLHKPLSAFDDVQANRVLEVLRDFVDNRGVQKPRENRDKRRPRTCIFSTATTKCTDAADQVLHVGGGTVRQVNNRALAQLRQNVRALLGSLAASGTGEVTREDFLRAFEEAPWAWALLGISNTQIEAGHESIEDLLLRSFTALDKGGTGVVDCEALQHFIGGCLDMRMLEMIASLTHDGELTGPIGWEVPPVPAEAAMLGGSGVFQADEKSPGGTLDLSHTISQSNRGLPKPA